MRVLLIEDDTATAQSIELMLKSEGFNVYTTDLGEEGVDLLLLPAGDHGVQLGALDTEARLVLGELHEFRVLLDARDALRVEEVEHHPAALAPGEVERLAVERGAAQRRRRSFGQRLEGGQQAAHRGTGEEVKVAGLDTLMDVSLDAVDRLPDGGFVMTNFVDFDTEFGHRRDPLGYGRLLEHYDAIGRFREKDAAGLSIDARTHLKWKDDVGFEFNNDEYSVGHPSLTADAVRDAFVQRRALVQRDDLRRLQQGLHPLGVVRRMAAPFESQQVVGHRHRVEFDGALQRRQRQRHPG